MQIAYFIESFKTVSLPLAFHHSSGNLLPISEHAPVTRLKLIRSDEIAAGSGMKQRKWVPCVVFYGS
jgi:hypothetical protein